MGKKKVVFSRENFDRYFCHGIDNKRDVKRGILYFSTKKVLEENSQSNWYKIGNQCKDHILEEATKKYKHFYRFVNLNDDDNNTNFKVDEQMVRQELEEELLFLKKEQKVIETKAGMFFVRGNEMSSRRKYVYGVGMQEEISWVEQIYQILVTLEKIEQENISRYYEYWLLAKKARTFNRGNKRLGQNLERIYGMIKENNDKKEKQALGRDSR